MVKQQNSPAPQPRFAFYAYVGDEVIALVLLTGTEAQYQLDLGSVVI